VDIIALLSNGFNAIAQVFGFQSKKLDLKNQPDVKQAAEAQKEAGAQDKARAAIAKKDTDEIRRDLSE
jgi:hypothetical protein